MIDSGNYVIKHGELTASQFIELWESVWGGAPSIEQVELALENTLFTVSIHDGGRCVAMARMIGDKGLCYYIKDVVVHPEYQGCGLGRALIDELLKFADENGVGGTKVAVELAAMPDKIPFYEKLGFGENEAHRLRMMREIKSNR